MRLGPRTVWLLSLALAISASQTVARADVTYTADAYTNPATNNLLPTNWNTATDVFPGLQSPAIPKFSGDPATLKEVDVTVKYSLNTLYSMTFNTASTITVSAIDPNNPQLSPKVNVGGSFPLQSFQPFLQIAPNSPLAPGLSKSVTYGFNPGETLPMTFNAANNPALAPFATSPTFTTVLSPTKNVADFNKFLGTGSIVFPFTAQGVSTFSSSSANGAGSVQTLAGAEITVTYVTTAVPEPASLILLGLGGGGIFLARRWRRGARGPVAV